MAYRTSGLIDARMANEDIASPDYFPKVTAALEEFAIESSIAKVFGSEAAGLLIDDAVQIHGGYGFIEEFSVERAYRDQRINRIYEGTNEINRMLITGMLLKRTMKGELPLFDLAQSVEQELTARSLPAAKPGPLGAERLVGEHLKRLAVYTLKIAAETHGPELDKHQLVLALVADIIIDAFALDSMLCRSRQSPHPASEAMIRLFALEAHARAFHAARKALCAAVPASERAQHLDRIEPLRPFSFDSAEELTETVTAAIEGQGGYPFSIT
jgi:hypothetical protein